MVTIAWCDSDGILDSIQDNIRLGCFCLQTESEFANSSYAEELQKKKNDEKFGADVKVSWSFLFTSPAMS